MDQDLVRFLIGCGVVCVMLAVGFRFFALWYWRIDEIVETLHSIDDSLRQLPAAREWRDARRMRAHRVA